MKTLQLKKGELKMSGMDPKPVTTAELILAVLDTPPKTGFTFEDLKKRQRIDAALTAAGQETALQLEEADYETLKSAALEKTWPFRADFIVDFVSSFTL
jgi:hypothetical protein